MASTGRAAIYARLSDDKKNTGENVDDQIRVARDEIAPEKDLEIFDVYPDNDRPASDPYNKPRPEFERLLEDAEAGLFDAVICRHVDRLYRHPYDQLRLSQIFGPRKIVVHQEWSGYPLDLSTPTGMLNAGIAAQVALYEIEHKRERQRGYEDRLLATGTPRHNTPSFGFNADMTPHDQQAELLRSASDRVLQGVSLGAIIREWNAAGVKTTRGGEWGYTSMRALLLRWSNAGIRQRTVTDERTQKREIVEHGPGTWEPIVEEATFRALREKLADPTRLKHRGDVGRKHLLSHILKCGRCGGSLRGGSVTSRAGKKYEIYQCGGEKESCRLSVMKDVAEDKVIRHVASRLASPSAGLLALTEKERESAAAKRERLKQLDQDELEIESSRISVKSKTRQLEALNDERVQIEKTLSGLTRRMALSALLMDVAPMKKGETFKDRAEVMQVVLERFNDLDLDRKRTVIRSLLQVVVAPHEQGVRGTPETAWKRIQITDIDPATGAVLEDWDETEDVA